MASSSLLAISLCTLAAAAAAATVGGHVVIFPEDARVALGDSVLLPCVVYDSEGQPPATVAWVKEGAVLDNGTSPGRVILHAPAMFTRGGVVFTRAVLEVCSARESDSGAYGCGVIGEEGGMAEFRLQVAPANPPVEILIAPRGIRNVPQNDSAVLMCVAVGDPPPTVIWSLNGAALPPTLSSLETDTRGGVAFVKSRLELCRITPSERDLYSCEASNGLSTSAVSFQLFPDIIRWERVPALLNQALVSGEVTFTCEALGFPPAHLGWSKNGTSLSNSSQNTVHSVTVDDGITLLTRSTLTIRDLRLADSGDYACSASNGRTSDTSSFHLSVNVPPTAIVVPSSQVVTTASSTLSFACAGYGVPSPTIVWQKDGAILSDQPSSGTAIQQSSVVKGGVTFVKSILQVCGGNSVGEYNCTVQNSIGYESSNFHIFPEVVGGIIVAPQDVFATPGDQVMLVCVAIGGTDTEVIWSRDVAPVDDGRAVRSREELVRGGYSIIKVTLELCIEEGDGGVYACVVRDALYSETATFEIEVPRQQFAPEVVASGETEVVENRGGNVNVSCIARGFPLSTVSWFHDGMELETDQAKVTITETRNVEEDEVESTLVLTELTAQDSGLYTCLAENTIGNTSSEFKLSVIPTSPATTVGVLPPVAVAFSHFSYSGGLICSLCCLAVLIAYVCSRDLRSSQTGLLVCNTCVALIALNLSFLASYFAPETQSTAACVLFSVLFHWLFLAACFALAVMVVLSLWPLEKHSKVVLGICLPLSWALPLVIGVVSMGASLTNYNSTEFCSPVMLSFWVALLPFFALTHLATWLLFLIALYIGCCVRRHKLSLKVWGAVTVLLLFDVAWGTGLPSSHTLGSVAAGIALQCIFAVVNSLVGVAMVLFFCCLSGTVRRQCRVKKGVVAPSTDAEATYAVIEPSTDIEATYATVPDQTSTESPPEKEGMTTAIPSSEDVEKTFQKVFEM